jgi:hypothetical protein
MLCTLCGQRRAKRGCPALGRDICPVCCATKRVVEIRCPADCVHLAAARQHPAAAVRRQHESDLRTLLAGLGPITEPQLHLFFLFHTAMANAPADGLPPLTDADVADAATAVAATLETAAKGVIFEHQAETSSGRRLAAALHAVVAEAGRGRGSRFEREAATVLRSIARAAAGDGQAARPERAYLELVARVVREGMPEAPAPAATSIILP